MIGSALSRLDTAEKLSIPQLQQAIQSGTIPAYMGVPLLEEKIAFEQRMRSAAAARMAQGQQPTIAEQVMDQAQMADQQMMDEGGIDQLPIEAPEFAGGGIVAFEDGGQVERFQNQGLVEDGFTPPQRGFLGTIFGPSAGMISREEVVRELTGPELQEFNRTGQLPARLRGKVGDMAISAPSGARDEGIAAAAPVAPRVAAQPQEPRTDLRAPVKMVDGRPVPIDVKTGKELGIAPDMDEEKPKVAAEPKPQDYMSRVDALFEQFYGGKDKEPTKPGDATSYLRATETFFRDAGVNLDLASQQAAELAKEKESLSKDKSEAANFRLIEAGLAIMGGTSPFAFENIGKGASKAMQGYVDDIKGLKKTEKELNAAARQLAVTQNQMRMGVAQAGKADYEKDLKRYEDAVQRNQDKMVDLYKTVLQDDRAREVVKAQMQRAPSIGELARADYLSGDPRRQQFAREYLGQTKTGAPTPAMLIKEFNDMKIIDRKRLEKQGITTAEEYVRYQMSGGQLGGASQGKTIDFGSI